ncbi:hypothetical protein O3P69_004931 [Scylla paramamosain]|uniref:Uncharacterized protein n=1 Tax=Scylla paramamosain TaxID=85552 RepID=A0AAW0UCC1_SCYPA
MKGVLTRHINHIDKLTSDHKNIQQVNEKLSVFPECIENFEEAHAELVRLLPNEELRSEEESYKVDVITRTRDPQEGISNWLAQYEDDGKDEEEVEETVSGVAVKQWWSTTLDSIEEENRKFEAELLELAKRTRQRQLELRNLNLKKEKECKKPDDPVKTAVSVLADALRQVLDTSRYQQQTVVESLHVPRGEFQTFDGDELEYWPWIKTNHDIRSKYKRGADITELVKFIRDAADEASDPVFGRLVNKEQKKDKGRNQQRSGLKHNTYLHLPNRKPDEDTNVQAPTVPHTPVFTPTPENISVPLRMINYVRSQGGKLALPIVPARVRCTDTETVIDTYAMLDPGTNATYCTEELCDKLGAKGMTRQMEPTTITQTRMPVESSVITLFVSDIHNKQEPCCIPEVTVKPSLNIDLSGLSSCVELQNLQIQNLQNLEIPKLDVDEVHLLIGQDCADLLLPDGIKKGHPGEPFAVHTPLG